MIEAFCARYTSERTRVGAGRRPRDWPTSRSATGLVWPGRSCGGATAGGIGPELDLEEEEFAVIRRAVPATYGKVRDRHPARYLDQHQVESLLGACVDGTWQGSRDQVAIRLGLLGIRVAEMCRLTWANLLPDGTVSWIGKGRRPRTVRMGPVFASRLERWERA
jgi:integrase